MYIYHYNNILICPDLEDLHLDILNVFSNKEFSGCRYDENPLNNLDIEFNIELSSSEKTSLDSIIETHI